MRRHKQLKYFNVILILGECFGPSWLFLCKSREKWALHCQDKRLENLCLETLSSLAFKRCPGWWWWWWWWSVFAEWLTDERRLRFISSRDHCQRFAPSQFSDTPQAGFEPARNLSSDFVERSCPVVITTKSRHHYMLKESSIDNEYSFVKTFDKPLSFGLF